MADFLTRLASRTLGLAPVAEPIIAPMFAPDPSLPAMTGADEALDASQQAAAPVATRVASDLQSESSPEHTVRTVVPQPRPDPTEARVAPPSVGEPIVRAAVPDDAIVSDLPARRRSQPSPPTVSESADEDAFLMPATGASERRSLVEMPTPAFPPLPVHTNSPDISRTPPTWTEEPVAATGWSAVTQGRTATFYDVAPDEPYLLPLTHAQAASTTRDASTTGLAGRTRATVAVTPAVTPADEIESPRRIERDQTAVAAVPSATPIIEVTIGRVEVRAVHPPAPSTRPKPVAPAEPRLSLEDYLRNQNGGKAMSNFLAIATVTATLRQILDDAVSKDVNGASATAVRPNAPSNQLPNPGVNVYLYHVTPNAAWRNADVPTRSADGGLMQRPRTAIDVHYLLSFYGSEGELEPQRVLGSAIRALHEQPILPRRKIRDVINAAAFLTTSNLDEEVELVKFTQLPLSLEELGKLWSVFFQTTHVLSVAFQGTVVLIEGTSTPRSTLPVRERNLYIVSFRQPVIEHVASAAGPQQPIIAGSTLRISGVSLRGNVTRVRIGQQVVAPTPDQVSDTQIDVALPAGLQAGIQSAQVEHPTLMGTPPTLHSGVESNAAPFVLQPSVTLAVSNIGPTMENGAPVVVDGVTLRSATVTATFTPLVGRTQRVKLVLYEFNALEGRPAHAYAFDAPLANGIANPAQVDTATIAFGVSRVSPGSYLARVQVDGAESPLSADANGRYNAPQVTI